MPIVGINYTVGVSETAQLVFQTHVPADMPKADLDGILDKLAASAQRQGAVAQLLHLEDLLANARKMAGRAIADQARIDAEFHGGEGRREQRLTPAQRKDRENANTTIERFKQDIANLEAKVAKAKELIGS